jgi:hypothetical protein
LLFKRKKRIPGNSLMLAFCPKGVKKKKKTSEKGGVFMTLWDFTTGSCEHSFAQSSHCSVIRAAFTELNMYTNSPF